VADFANALFAFNEACFSFDTVLAACAFGARVDLAALLKLAAVFPGKTAFWNATVGDGVFAGWVRCAARKASILFCAAASIIC
jgi:hypothetical protein